MRTLFSSCLFGQTNTSLTAVLGEHFFIQVVQNFLISSLTDLRLQCSGVPVTLFSAASIQCLATPVVSTQVVLLP